MTVTLCMAVAGALARSRLPGRPAVIKREVASDQHPHERQKQQHINQC